MLAHAHRRRLENRRPHEVVSLEHNGFRLTIGIGRYSDGRLAEVFIDTRKGGTAIDTILKDSAILLSFALQAGIDTATIRRVTGGSRIDVFSREQREGFAQFGNEIGRFAA